MADRSRSRTVLLTVAAATVAAIGAVGAAGVLLEVLDLAAAPLRITLTPGMRYGIIGVALVGVVPTTAAAVLRARRPSTDFLHRR